MDIRKISDNEIKHTLELILDVFSEFEAPDYSEEGINTFKQFLDDDKTISSLSIHGAFDDNILLGVIAIRNNNHICMFFVKKEYHKQGIGKKLFLYFLKNCKEQRITVNSSPFAVDFYHKIGFNDIDKEQILNGIKFTPMEFIRKEV